LSILYERPPKQLISVLWLLDHARAWGGPHQCVVADADYGDNPNFLAGLEARQEPYVVPVRTDFLVSIGQMASTPAWRADALLQNVPRWQWRTIRWRWGTQGWLRKKFVAVRGWRVSRDGSRLPAGGGTCPQGQPEERKYFWSNLSQETPLEVLAGYAHRRHAIEQLHAEATGELGWDQYQGRLWPGFHRHAATVMLAYSVLVWLERQQRRSTKRPGRPRDLFLPSAEPQA
jgi:SRSO17 transposase